MKLIRHLVKNCIHLIDALLSVESKEVTSFIAELGFIVHTLTSIAD
jgi:hypothetical protein